MVRIIGYKQRQREDGETFLVLEIQGGIEMIKSKSTDSFYATAKKAFIPSTFDEQTCIALIGTEMPGSIIKQECEPYEYIVKETGEEILLNHRWVYTSEENPVPREESNQKDTVLDFTPTLSHFSSNGSLHHA